MKKGKNMKILILNGPNLNLLGVREPAVYGNETLHDIEEKCLAKAQSLNWTITWKQSNHEGELVELIQQALNNYDAIIINPAAFTHTSVAILDALKTVNIPTVEVHLSNVFKREEFRHHSYVSLVAIGVISGFGSAGYLLALEYLNLKK
ncbi:MAG: type II 3-dehydroquinate dehydratase [Mycoplasmataceae bacterium]|nr:type II 3-dehydroquinate dehydratase [Mycoplasmataceae bacterium]